MGKESLVSSTKPEENPEKVNLPLEEPIRPTRRKAEYSRSRPTNSFQSLKSDSTPSLHSSIPGPLPVLTKSEKQMLRRAAREATEGDDSPDATRKQAEKEEIDRLRKEWYESTKDVICPAPPKLPKKRAINHRIPLIDEQKREKYHMPRCPEALRGELRDKIKRYTESGWWVEKPVPQAPPLLCIPKKSNKLRTVVDCRKRNDNTVKDLTPFPDQDQIRMDVAKARYRTKIDMSDAYEQIRIEDEDVWKTAFATTMGTFISLVMQQGDCNAPATFQRLMTHVFRDFIGDFVHVYLDDIFVFSDTIEDHQKHLQLVFDRLRKEELYLSTTNCDIYSNRMECLGHIIDDRGLHADADKMSKVRDWPVPTNYNEVQQFLGLVQYLSNFMPDVSAYSSVLAGMVRNGRTFLWRPIH